MLVSEIMKRNVITIRPEETIREAIRKIFAHRIRHLLVTSTDGDLLGVLSDRDLREAAPSRLSLNEEEFRVLDHPVSTIMTEEVITCHPSDFVEEAAHLLYENKIGCLPVLSHGKVVGIITESDLLHTLVELMGVHQPSSHVEVEVEDQIGSLADVAQIFKKAGVNVYSVLIQPAETIHRKRLVFRVQTIDPRRLVKRLEEEGVKVLWPKKWVDADE
ncbi:CBS and ACT domain-containing protein [Thermicanus aegyptius]|uniref:CBS and ACT domain-containing protein n=1 Tax=Thermicanus aegyptius TaxID=94009 RepID=UPI0004242D9D|nr:CBS and ACT domain-containing protein [Thermicanus aegyptius]